MLTDDKEISREEYDELRRKAVIYDLIEDDIRQNIDEGRLYGPVDDDLVMKLTGMRRYLTMRHAENAAAAAMEKEDALNHQERFAGMLERLERTAIE